MHVCTCFNFSPHSFSDPLLFVNVDISDCYDTINSRKLYDIMEQILVTAAQNTVRDNINVHCYSVLIARLHVCVLGQDNILHYRS